MYAQKTSKHWRYICGQHVHLALHLVVMFLAVSLGVAQAQTCATGPDDAIQLTSQQEINDFQTTYGPCSIVDVFLTIAGEDISDLSPLSELVDVQSYLFIQDNPDLLSLDGLSNLAFVDNLWINRNDKLVDLSGLAKLESIRYELDISGNNALKTLDGLPPEVSLGYWLTIASNPLLEEITALSDTNMQSLMFLIINVNEALRSLAGLAAIEQLQKLEVIGNKKLRTLEGIKVNNGFVNGLVSIQNNSSLISFAGLEWLESAEKIFISRNHAITNFKGLSGLKNVGDFSVEENDSLQNFTGLEQLEYVGSTPGITMPAPLHNNFRVRSNPSLTSFNGLSSLKTIEGNLWIYFSPELTSLQGLNNVEHIGKFSLNLNSELENLDALSSLRSVIDLSIFDNEVLGGCSALEALLDVIDHGKPGPGPGENNAPDVAGTVYIEANAYGCNTIEQIAPRPDVEKVMTGSWYSPASSGEGFMIHVVKEHDPNPLNRVNGLIVGYFYGYDEQGDRFWLVGVYEGEMSWDEPIEFTATLATGGGFEGFDPSVIDRSTWGSFSFMPGNCNTGTITMSGEFSGESDVREKTLEVVRLGDVAGDYCAQQSSSGMTDSITGSWYDPATSGQGYSIHKLNEQTGAVYFYGFDSTGKPLWLLGVWRSALNPGEAVEIEMSQYIGGTFSEVNPDEIIYQPWGSMLLRMDDCGVAYAELDGLDGKQIFFMQQLAGTLGLECID